MSILHIILYHLGLVLGAVVLFLAVQFSIPESWFKKCTVCEEFEEVVVKGRSKRRCLKHRAGTREECKKGGMLVKIGVGLIVAAVVIGVVNGVFGLLLRARIFTPTVVRQAI